MKFLLLILISFSVQAQTAIKIKREDNRFLFFQTGIKNDTIVKNRSDRFLLILPDSLSQHIRIDLKNAMLISTTSDSIFVLRPVPGMKYSHSKHDTIFETLVEGPCHPSSEIWIEFLNTKSRQIFLQNKFLAK
jgi:hypothetical protein